MIFTYKLTKKDSEHKSICSDVYRTSVFYFTYTKATCSELISDCNLSWINFKFTCKTENKNHWSCIYRILKMEYQVIALQTNKIYLTNSFCLNNFVVIKFSHELTSRTVHSSDKLLNSITACL